MNTRRSHANKRLPGPYGLTSPRFSAFTLNLMLGLTATLSALLAWAETTPVAQQRYEIAAGSLEDALNRYSNQAGITLSFDPALVAGKQAAALNGNYRVQEGLNAVLSGSGLEAVLATDGTWALRQLPQTAEGVTTLSTVTVTAEIESVYGPVEGYKANRSATATKTDTPIIANTGRRIATQRNP